MAGMGGRQQGRGRRGRTAPVTLAVATFVTAVALLPTSSADAATSSGWLARWFRPTTTTTTSTSTTTTTTTTTVSPTAGRQVASGPNCGPVVVKADGSPWVCTLADDFDGTALNRSLWVPQTSAASGFGSQDDCYVDDPDNVRLRNGALELSVIKEAAPFTCTTPKKSYTTQYTAASVSTWQRWSQAFGRFEFRAKFPSSTVKGLHGALWLWPDNALKYGPWPASGEIDVAEVYSYYNDRAIPYIHYVTSSTTNRNNYCLLKVDDWHTYTLEWTTSTLTIRFDGVVCVKEKIAPTIGVAPQPFDQPFMLALTQGLGIDGNRMDPATPPPFPATLAVDHVRVWK
jgi:hypothetical protein